MHHLGLVEIIFLIFIGALIIIEAFFSGIKDTSISHLHKRTRSDFWDVFSVVTSVSGLHRIMENVLWFGLFVALSEGAKSFALLPLTSVPPVLKAIVILLIFDFLNYVFHRLNHNSNWLWLTHEFHHSAERLTIFTNWRSHPLRSLTKPRFLMLLLFGAAPELLVVSIFRDFFVLTNHLRWDTSWGWLGRYVFVSPRAHYLHHEKFSQRGNYSDVFIFWDILFGTYKAPVKSIHSLEYGLESSRFKDKNLAYEFLMPVWQFYTYPVMWVQNRRVKDVGRPR